MYSDAIVSIAGAVPSTVAMPFIEPLYWSVRRGEHWAIAGANGSGKSLTAGIVCGRYPLRAGSVRYGLTGKPHEGIKSISFRDIYSTGDMRNAYYQQRWHATEVDGLPAVRDMFAAEPDAGMARAFGLEGCFDKKIIHLSGGEMRKCFLLRALMSAPEILIIDNPYAGLDIASREMMNAMLTQIAAMRRTQLMLLIADAGEIPDVITHVLPVVGGRYLPPASREAFLADAALLHEVFPTRGAAPMLPPARREASTHRVTFRMENITLRYGNRTVFDGLNWEALNGEKWSLTGPNGSGKSLLLSMLYADNPQAYAQRLYVFDRRRGTGESIWDVKRRTGYVSPEMHLYYADGVGAHRDVVAAWMETFGIGGMSARPFSTLSFGEQRLMLLAGAFANDPDLLILDEPMHGLDAANRARVRGIITDFCAREGKTLVYVTHCFDEMPDCVTRHFSLY
ncbi:MAG: ATP-binding cassette domain-containing protein [Tannerella sp.]|jgi:molybdate transport system ATP-binding protein|nr:ATP-binding cassette domain-containing protein [Tannerella sp.]